VQNPPSLSKYDTEKYKCQLHHSISKTVTLFALMIRAPGQLPCNLAPIVKKNFRSTMLCYSLYKEVILFPAPQCLMVRYRKGIRPNCPTSEKLEDGPSPEHGTEPADDRGRPPRAPTGTAVAQRSEAGQGILGDKEGKGIVSCGAVSCCTDSTQCMGGA
jgi:hypothetical protein